MPLGGCAALTGGSPALVAAGPGVHVRLGEPEPASHANGGRTGNAGFIVGPRGMLVVDSGASLADGRELLAAAQRLAPDAPLRGAVLTHAQPAFVFGAGALRERGVAVRMHEAAAALMLSRCHVCLANLRRDAGRSRMRGTELRPPDATFTGSHAVEDIGRRVEVLHFGPSSGPGDVAVFDRDSGVLFAGGLLDAGRIPDLQDADVDGWRAALVALRTLPITAIVPGHGPVSPPALIDTMTRYLVGLDAALRPRVMAGEALLTAGEAAALPEFAHWAGYDSRHRRNAERRFVQLEAELVFR